MVNIIMVTVVAFNADCRFAKCRHSLWHHAELCKTESFNTEYCYAVINDTYESS
jgi:hypothetical protein